MQILGKIRGGKVVLNDEDYSYAAKPVTSLPDPDTSTDNIIFLTNTEGGFIAGSILKKTVDPFGTASWDVVRPPETGVGACYNVRSYLVRTTSQFANAYIRWSDPYDVSDAYGNLTKRWQKTVLVKKLGSMPNNINDGTVCIVNFNRNAYQTEPFVDQIPIESVGSHTWNYRIFAISEDGTVDSPESSCLTPIVINWNYMSNYIQAGWGSKLFAPGDQLITTGGVSPWNDLECTVAGFDIYKSALPGKKRTMTLFFEVPVANSLPFDIPWGPYHLTQDEIAIATTIYYQRLISGSNISWKTITSKDIPQGFRIVDYPQTYFEAVMSADNALHGTNNWSQCELRRWANWLNTGSYVYDPGNCNRTYSFPIGAGTNPREKLASAETDDGVGLFAKALTPVYVQTAKKVGISTILETTVDRFFVPSLTEILGIKNAGLEEGTQWPIFRTGLGIYGSFWTRSAKVDTPSNLEYYMRADGHEPTFVADGISADRTSESVVLAFTLA